MANKKGIAVLSTVDGSPIHKLVDDGSARIGGGAGKAVVLNGVVKVENLNVPTTAGKMNASGDTADSIADAINGISGSLKEEIDTNGTARRSGINTQIENLKTTAGVTNAGDTSANGVGQLDCSFVHTGARYINDTDLATYTTANGLDRSFFAVDEALNAEVGIQLGEITTLEARIITDIAAVVGALTGSDLQNIEDMSASLGGDTAFAISMLTSLTTAIDDLDGLINQQMTGDLSASADAVKAERVRAKGNDAADATVTGGSQGGLQTEIDQVQQGVGLDDQAAWDSATFHPDGAGAVLPAATDIALAVDVKTMEDRITALTGTKFEAQDLLIEGTSNIAGRMMMEGANASFNFPVRTAQEVVDSTYGQAANDSANNGKVFYLSDTSAACNALITAGTLPQDFAEGKKLYFCENGIWHSSYLLKQETA